MTKLSVVRGDGAAPATESVEIPARLRPYFEQLLRLGYYGDSIDAIGLRMWEDAIGSAVAAGDIEPVKRHRKPKK